MKYQEIFQLFFCILFLHAAFLVAMSPNPTCKQRRHNLFYFIIWICLVSYLGEGRGARNTDREVEVESARERESGGAVGGWIKAYRNSDIGIMGVLKESRWFNWLIMNGKTKTVWGVFWLLALTCRVISWQHVADPGVRVHDVCSVHCFFGAFGYCSLGFRIRVWK